MELGAVGGGARDGWTMGSRAGEGVLEEDLELPFKSIFELKNCGTILSVKFATQPKLQLTSSSIEKNSALSSSPYCENGFHPFPPAFSMTSCIGISCATACWYGGAGVGRLADAPEPLRGGGAGGAPPDERLGRLGGLAGGAAAP